MAIPEGVAGNLPEAEAFVEGAGCEVAFDDGQTNPSDSLLPESGKARREKSLAETSPPMLRKDVELSDDSVRGGAAEATGFIFEGGDQGERRTLGSPGIQNGKSDEIPALLDRMRNRVHEQVGRSEHDVCAQFKILRLVRAQFIAFGENRRGGRIFPGKKMFQNPDLKGVKPDRKENISEEVFGSSDRFVPALVAGGLSLNLWSFLIDVSRSASNQFSQYPRVISNGMDQGQIGFLAGNGPQDDESRGTVRLPGEENRILLDTSFPRANSAFRKGGSKGPLEAFSQVFYQRIQSVQVLIDFYVHHSHGSIILWEFLRRRAPLTENRST